MIDTSGFYRVIDNSIQFAPNAVFAPSYTLKREEKETYTIPIDGWKWFDSQEEASLEYGITIKIEKEMGRILPKRSK